MAMLSERVLGCGPKEYEHLKAEIQRTLRVANSVSELLTDDPRSRVVLRSGLDDDDLCSKVSFSAPESSFA